MRQALLSKLVFPFVLVFVLVICLVSFGMAWATTTSTITIDGTDYTLFTGFNATGGTEGTGVFVYGNMVDGDLSSSFHAFTSPAYVEFNSDAPIIPKGYIFNTYNASNFKPTGWVLKAKADTADEWTTLSSQSGSLTSGQEFQYACDNSGNNAYKYFRFEVSNNSNNIWLTEIRLYGSSPDVWYTHLTVKAATCTETGIKQDCYQRNDGKYFTDETGTTELAESDVIEPMISHNGQHHDATDTNIEYWQCSMCSKYFSDSGCTTEITEEETKIYRTITIDDGISELVMRGVDKALTGTTVTLYVISNLIDASTLKVNNGSVVLTDAGNGTYTFTVPAADVTVTASVLSTYSVTLPANMVIVSATNAADGNGKYISGTVVTFAASLRYAATNVSDGTNTLEPDAYGIYTVTVAAADINITATTTESGNTLYLAGATSDFTAVDGDILIGSTSHTVTIENNAKITLSNATISGGIVCDGTAEITLVGTNNVTGAQYKAGIQVGGSGTTLTIKGNGSLTAAGNRGGAGIGTSVVFSNGSNTSGNITIMGGSITANGAEFDPNNHDGGNGIGKGYTYANATNTVGTVTITTGIDRVEASSISETVVYRHGETDVTSSVSTYFTITENGSRRIIEPKLYDVTISESITNGAITANPAQAVIGDTVTLTVKAGYEAKNVTVKNGSTSITVTDNGNGTYSFTMPAGAVTVEAEVTPISYTITYELDGGTVATVNPTSYTIETETFTLNNPTKNGSTFAGWTGTGLSGATMTVEIAKGSTGARTYTATWTGGGSTPDPDAPVFKGQTLILGGQIGVIFYVDIPETYRNPNDCWMEFEVSGDEFSTSDRRPQSYNGDDYIAGPSGENCYKFTCYINSVQMADNINAILHYGSGCDTVTYQYTALTYLNRAMNADSGYEADVVALATAINDFGSYVQPVLAEENHWQYGVDHVKMNAVSSYSDNDFERVKSAVSSYALNYDKSSSTTAGIANIGHTLQLESTTTLIMYLAPSSDYTGKVYVKVDNGTEEEADYSSGNNYYVVIIENIAPHELDDPHTITVRTEKGTFDITVYALSYVNSVLNSANSNAMKEAVTSLYEYYAKTVTYRSNRPNEYGNN